jgi:hypothetical protein
MRDASGVMLPHAHVMGEEAQRVQVVSVGL